MFGMASLFLLLGAAVVLAAGGIDLSGSWTLDKSKSDPPAQMGRGGARGAGGIYGGTLPGRGRAGGGRRGGGQDGDTALAIEQTADALVITRKMGSGDPNRSLEQHFRMDGAETTNPAPMGRGNITSTVQLTGDALVIQNKQTVSGPNGEMVISSKEEFSLADNGQTLIIKTTRFTPRGELTHKQVFTKQ